MPEMELISNNYCNGVILIIILQVNQSVQYGIKIASESDHLASFLFRKCFRNNYLSIYSHVSQLEKLRIIRHHYIPGTEKEGRVLTML